MDESSQADPLLAEVDRALLGAGAARPSRISLLSVLAAMPSPFSASANCNAVLRSGFIAVIFQRRF